LRRRKIQLFILTTRTKAVAVKEIEETLFIHNSHPFVQHFVMLTSFIKFCSSTKSFILPSRTFLFVFLIKITAQKFLISMNYGEQQRNWKKAMEYKLMNA
jgi:hypothetical protein